MSPAQALVARCVANVENDGRRTLIALEVADEFELAEPERSAFLEAAKIGASDA